MSGRWLAPVLVAALSAFVAVGFVGVDRYAKNYWLYRGFPPPSDPAYVTQQGSVEQIKVASAALGGRSQSVYGYRRMASRQGRGIAGLSEGGYGALNIALQHPGEFSLVESWSGYERAAQNHSIFGRQLEGLAANTPLERVAATAATLRRNRAYFWFYSGTDDPLRLQHREFA